MYTEIYKLEMPTTGIFFMLSIRLILFRIFHSKLKLPHCIHKIGLKQA